MMIALFLQSEQSVLTSSNPISIINIEYSTHKITVYIPLIP